MSKLRFYSQGLAISVLSLLLIPNSSFASDSGRQMKPAKGTVTVTALNYVQAKTAIQFDKYLERANGKMNTFSHARSLVSVDAKSSKRLNRDTLYSVALIDIRKGATLVMPNTGDRYVSAQVVNELGYTNKVFYGEGQFDLSITEFHTPFVWVLIRTLVSEAVPGDIAAANALQDQMKIMSKSHRQYTHPTYDPVSFEKVTRLLVELGAGVQSNVGAAGKKGEVDPIMQLLVAAYGFGTLPEKDSFLVNVQPSLPADQGYTLTVKDVPVDGFWSLTVYNKDGYFIDNEFSKYGVNDRTAIKNKDDSVTIHFGGNPKERNFVPIEDGWNYVVRLYRPRMEVLTGAWVFPPITTLQ